VQVRAFVAAPCGARREGGERSPVHVAVRREGLYVRERRESRKPLALLRRQPYVLIVARRRVAPARAGIDAHARRSRRLAPCVHPRREPHREPLEIVVVERGDRAQERTHLGAELAVREDHLTEEAGEPRAIAVVAEREDRVANR
jgi:hypothetical protein